jgi:FkbM family methyltransferase
MTQKYINKVRVQIEDVVSQKSLRARAQIVLCVVNRRRIPLPSAIYEFFTDPCEDNAADLGNEKFLAEYIIPESDKCFVDVGASIGDWTFFVAKEGNEVYAFEPSPKAYGILRKKAQTYSNVKLYMYALGDKDVVGRLGLSAFTLSGTMDLEINDLPGGGTIDVPVHKLDSLQLPTVGVIKIDTEGYEIPILQGARKTIQKDKPRIIIEIHKATGKAAETYDEELRRIKIILDDFGYKWIVRHRLIRLSEHQPFVIGFPIIAKKE